MAIVDIDPDGDIIVEIGEERLRVASKVMDLASPVFKAMFNSGFREGLTSETTASSPKHISLPDDDPATFIYLCNIVHLRNATMPKDVDTQQVSIAWFEKLAEVVDKYRITAPLNAHAEATLQELARRALDDEVERLLLAAYLLDAPTAFSAISLKLIALQEGPWKPLPSLTEHPTVGCTLVDELNTRRLEIFQFVAVALHLPTHYFVRVQNQGLCAKADEWVGKYLSQLNNRGILPYTDEFFSKSFAEIQKHVPTAFENCSPHRSRSTNATCKTCIKESSYAREQVLQLLRIFMQQERGVCLDCVKTGRQSKAKGMCRYNHEMSRVELERLKNVAFVGSGYG